MLDSDNERGQYSGGPTNDAPVGLALHLESEPVATNIYFQSPEAKMSAPSTEFITSSRYDDITTSSTSDLHADSGYLTPRSRTPSEQSRYLTPLLEADESEPPMPTTPENYRGPETATGLLTSRRRFLGHYGPSATSPIRGCDRSEDSGPRDVSEFGDTRAGLPLLAGARLSAGSSYYSVEHESEPATPIRDSSPEDLAERAPHSYRQLVSSYIACEDLECERLSPARSSRQQSPPPSLRPQGGPHSGQQRSQIEEKQNERNPENGSPKSPPLPSTDSRDRARATRAKLFSETQPTFSDHTGPGSTVFKPLPRTPSSALSSRKLAVSDPVAVTPDQSLTVPPTRCASSAKYSNDAEANYAGSEDVVPPLPPKAAAKDPGPGRLPRSRSRSLKRWSLARAGIIGHKIFKAKADEKTEMSVETAASTVDGNPSVFGLGSDGAKSRSDEHSRDASGNDPSMAAQITRPLPQVSPRSADYTNRTQSTVATSISPAPSLETDLGDHVSSSDTAKLSPQIHGSLLRSGAKRTSVYDKRISSLSVASSLIALAPYIVAPGTKAETSDPETVTDPEIAQLYDAVSEFVPGQPHKRRTRQFSQSSAVEIPARNLARDSRADILSLRLRSRTASPQPPFAHGFASAQQSLNAALSQPLDVDAQPTRKSEFLNSSPSEEYAGWSQDSTIKLGHENVEPLFMQDFNISTPSLGSLADHYTRPTLKPIHPVAAQSQPSRRRHRLLAAIKAAFT